MKTSEAISTFGHFIGWSEVLKIIFLTSDIRVMIMRHKFEVIQGGLSVAELQPLGCQLSYYLQLQVSGSITAIGIRSRAISKTFSTVCTGIISKPLCISSEISLKSFLFL